MCNAYLCARHKLGIFPVDWQLYASAECTNVHSRIANERRMFIWEVNYLVQQIRRRERAVSCVLQHLMENSLEKFPTYISIAFSVDVAVVVVKFIHVETIFSNGIKSFERRQMNGAQVNGDGKSGAAEKTLVAAAAAYQSARVAAGAPHSISAIYLDLQQTNVFVDLILNRITARISR